MKFRVRCSGQLTSYFSFELPRFFCSTTPKSMDFTFAPQKKQSTIPAVDLGGAWPADQPPLCPIAISARAKHHAP
jgi:hypothetical protein